MSGSGVRIPIDVSETLRALNQIRDAIKATGQEARAFAALDLSHPELKEHAADIKQLQRQMEALIHVGRGASANLARSVFTGPTDTLFGQRGLLTGSAIGDTYLNPQTARQVQAQILSYVTRGTSFAPGGHAPSPPPSGGGAPPPMTPQSAPMSPGGGGLGAGMLGSVLPMLSRFVPQMAMAGLALSGLQRLGSMAADAVNQGAEEARGTDTLYRTLRDTTTDFGALRSAVRDVTEGLGLTYLEAQRLALTYAQLSGAVEASAVAGGVRTAAGFARGYGMDPSATTAGFGRAAFLGEDPRRFAMILADAIQSSGMTSNPQQVMETLLRFQESNARQFGGAAALEQFASLYGHLSGSGDPRMRGAGAEALLGRMNQAVAAGGAAGDASQYLTYRALGRYGVSNPYQIEYALAGGMFGGVNGGDANAAAGNPTILQAMAEEIMRLYPGESQEQRFRRNHALGRHFGINPRAAEAFFGAMQSYGGSTISSALQGAGVDVGLLRPDAIRDLAAIQAARGDELGRWRQNVLGRLGPNDDADRHALRNAEGEDLRRIMLRIVADRGREETEGSRLQQSFADLNNNLTRAGSGLIPALTDMRSGLAATTGAVADLTELFGDVYLALTRNDQGAQARLAARGQLATGEIMRFFGVRPGNGGGVGGNAGPGSPGWQDTQAPELSAVQRNFLDAIAGPESAGRYNVRYTPNGGAMFSDLSRHPRQFEAGPAGPSSAAGRYQIVATTWDRIAPRLGLNDFGPANQDRAAWEIARSTYEAAYPGRSLEADLRDPGRRAQIEGALRSQWGTINLGRMRRPNMNTIPRAPNLTPGGPGPAGSTGDTPGPQSSLTFNPLRVIVENTRGDRLSEQFLGLEPNTGGSAPVPWGMG